MPDAISHPVFAAVYDPVTWVAERTLLGPHRAALADGLQGRVLDLGAGTGAMFPHFAAARASAPAVSLHAIEPDSHMIARASRRASRLGLEVDLQLARAETLPYPDEYFDVVVAAMVFCTIPDVEAALGEVTRVLKPDGEVRFLEHVAATGWQRRFQALVAPFWKRVAGGCHVTRDVEAILGDAPGLEVIELRALRIGIPPVRPFVRGRLHPQPVQN